MRYCTGSCDIENCSKFCGHHTLTNAQSQWQKALKEGTVPDGTAQTHTLCLFDGHLHGTIRGQKSIYKNRPMPIIRGGASAYHHHIYSHNNPAKYLWWYVKIC